MKIERIVAATDLSQASEQALQRAAQLAAVHGAELQLVTVLPSGWLAQMRSWLAGADVQAGAEAIGQRLERCAAALERDRLRIVTQVLEGDARDEVAAHAQRVDARLVVVGAHGRSLVGETVLGSTALALLERCDVPILVVRNGAAQAYRRALAGIIFASASTEAVRFAAALCPGAEIALLHAYEDPFAAELFLGQAGPEVESHYRMQARQSAQQALDGFVAQLGPLAQHCNPLLAYGPPGLQLAHEAQHQRADLVVLGSRRKGKLEAALLGSVASNAAMMVTADVLLVREGTTTAAP
jgi:nucleotide-binding universal stress UspA family protein